MVPLRKNKLLIFFMMCPLVIACTPTYTIIGLYERKNGVSSEKLILRGDKTFEYSIYRNLCRDTVLHGIWVNQGRRIQVNSANTVFIIQGMSNEVVEKYNSQIHGVRFRLIYADKSANFQGSLYVDSDPNYIKVDTSYTPYPKSSIKGFSISSLLLSNDLKYSVRQKRSNSFDIKINPENSCDLSKIATKFVLRNSKLIPESGKGHGVFIKK